MAVLTKGKMLAKIHRLELEVETLKVAVFRKRAGRPIKSSESVAEKEDPVLAELWDNPSDARYDELPIR